MKRGKIGYENPMFPIGFPEKFQSFLNAYHTFFAGIADKTCIKGCIFEKAVI